MPHPLLNGRCRIAGALLATSLLAACSSSSPRRPPPLSPSAGSGGGQSAGGNAGTGFGAGGTGGGGGSGGSAGSPGGTPILGSPDALAPAPADAARPDAARVDAAATSPDGGVRACWPDPRVIMICHQLENACENCPPGGAPPKNKLAQVCFDLVARAYKGMASDADCAKFAADNRCTVDNAATTGNVCGSLDCNAPGCTNKARCLDRQQWGDSSMCQPFMATCACK
jgi:hypothetical protein